MSTTTSWTIHRHYTNIIWEYNFLIVGSPEMSNDLIIWKFNPSTYCTWSDH
ncbi:unnamed protein product [Schistosoma curassoni]|uniref:Ovule protein n=1 Tax=Schistosoma curassoni TaxID=6186 RepID=A0A183JL96_9TREM|nr:unnamed protein product [Schistosoma curassoni]